MTRAITRIACYSALTLIASVCRAQVTAPLPSSSTCNTWAQQLSGTRQQVLQGLMDNWYGGCPTTGPSALATTITSLRSSTDTIVLRLLAIRAGRLTHPSILSAALDVAQDKAHASQAARAASLLILSGQMGGGLRIEGLRTPNELTVPISGDGVCGPGVAMEEGVNPASTGLPSDAERRTATVLDRIYSDVSETSLLRTLAKCVRPVLGGAIPLQIDLTNLTLSNVCGTRFLVHNGTANRLSFQLVVSGTTETFEMTAKPGEDLRITTDNTGAVSLIYDGQTIRQAANGSPCH